MNNGGYKIIDFNSVDRRDGIPMVCEGIYDIIEGTNKAIMVSGLVINGHEFHDEIVKLTHIENAYYLIGNEFIIEINDRDVFIPVENSNRISINMPYDDYGESDWLDGGKFSRLTLIARTGCTVKWTFTLSIDNAAEVQSREVSNLHFTTDKSNTFISSSFTVIGYGTTELKNVGIYIDNDNSQLKITYIA